MSEKHDQLFIEYHSLLHKEQSKSMRFCRYAAYINESTAAFSEVLHFLLNNVVEYKRAWQGTMTIDLIAGTKKIFKPLGYCKI